MINKLVFRVTKVEIIYHYRGALLSYWPKICADTSTVRNETHTVSTILQELWGGGEGVMEGMGDRTVPALGSACREHSRACRSRNSLSR